MGGKVKKAGKVIQRIKLLLTFVRQHQFYSHAKVR